MACLQQEYILAKRQEKITKYRQLAFGLRERRSGCDIIIPLTIITIGGRVE